MKIKINGIEYIVEKDNDKIIDIDLLEQMVTDYFNNYDYIFGDIAYDKLRLKGFYESKNKLTKKINDIKYLDDYLKDFCACQCPYFLIKKQINIEKVQ